MGRTIHQANADLAALQCLASARLPLQYYDIASVSMRNVVWPLMAAGIAGFKARQLLRMGVAACGARCPAAPARCCLADLLAGLNAAPSVAPSLVVQPDKILAGGNISPRGIQIPQASQEEKHDFYYTDK